MEQDIYSKVKSIADQYGLPDYVWYPIIMTESGGNPDSIGDNGQSFGLFQINKPSHPTFDLLQYNNPTYQAEYQIPYLVEIYKQGVNQGVQGVELTKYVEKYGQRPVWNNTVSSNIEKYYLEITGGNKSVSGTTANNTGQLQGTNVGIMESLSDKWYGLGEKVGNFFMNIWQNLIFVILFIAVILIIYYSSKEVLN
jgi:hypothetical protein